MFVMFLCFHCPGIFILMPFNTFLPRCFFFTTTVIRSRSMDILCLKHNVQRHVNSSCWSRSEPSTFPVHIFPAGLHGLKPASLTPRLLLPPQHCRGPSCYIAPTYICVCARACVSSCTHIQLMKSKCLAAVVTVVRLSQCLQSKATKQLDPSWFKAAVERGQIQIRSY